MRSSIDPRFRDHLGDAFMKKAVTWTYSRSVRPMT